MRALVVADIHANLEALQAVLEEAQTIDAVWCLGDTAGYGPDPDACIELLRGYPLQAVAGNHDLAAAGTITTADFNPYAAAAARWTAVNTSAGNLAWLRELSSVLVLPDGFTLTHGSLTDPVWEYLLTPDRAAQHLARQTTPYGLVGHTHLPRVFYEEQRVAVQTEVPDASVIELGEQRFVANPGSVGQPRDGDPRAAYALADTDAQQVTFHRVEYEIAVTQAKIVEAGLPPLLAERLSHGR